MPINPPPDKTIYFSRTCMYCDDIGVCNKKPREGLFRPVCITPCKIGKSNLPKPPPPPPPRYLKG